MLRPHDSIFIRLDKTLERGGRTDGRTDITAVCIASNAVANAL